MKNFKTSQEIIDFAVRAEEEAVRFYTDLADSTNTKALKEAFIEFADEEQKHKDKLLSINSQELTFPDSTPITDLHIADYVNPEVQYKSLTYGEVLIIAMNREKRAYMLYDKLAKMTDNSALRKMFQFLAKEEIAHKNRFETEYDDFVLKEN